MGASIKINPDGTKVATEKLFVGTENMEIRKSTVLAQPQCQHGGQHPSSCLRF